MVSQGSEINLNHFLGALSLVTGLIIQLYLVLVTLWPWIEAMDPHNQASILVVKSEKMMEATLQLSPLVSRINSCMSMYAMTILIFDNVLFVLTMGKVFYFQFVNLQLD